MLQIAISQNHLIALKRKEWPLESMRYSKYPSRACICFTALCEALCPLQYNLVNQFSRSQLKATETVQMYKIFTSGKTNNSVNVKTISWSLLQKSKPANIYPIDVTKRCSQNRLQNVSRGSKERYLRCKQPLSLSLHERRKCWRDKRKYTYLGNSFFPLESRWPRNYTLSEP